MSIIDTFGSYVSSLSDNHPKAARTLLKTGWQLQGFKFSHFPDKRLIPSDRYLASLMMDTMSAPLKSPEKSVIVSIFMPCEIIEEAGLVPYDVEGMSCYISASRADKIFNIEAMDAGIPDTLCSYHRTFIGAAYKGLLPTPKFIAYTNLICDANMLTFKTLADYYGVPSFYVEVPKDRSDASVRLVADELREMKSFVEKCTGQKIDDAAVGKRVERSKRTLELFASARKARKNKCVITDIVSPMYLAITNNILLGTKGEENYVNMLLNDVRLAGPKKGKHIYWMHTIPYWSDAVKKSLWFNENAQIVGDELADAINPDFDSSDPYEAMAHRMVYNNINGDAMNRIQAGIRHAKETGADGVVWFNHWGCKHTIGSSLLAKKEFERAGLPLLILDGDGCDRSHGGEGQTATRLEAFLEMLD